MKLELIEKIVDSQKERLPLSYRDLVFKKQSEEVAMNKIICSDYYKDNNFLVFPLFKNISRLL